MHLENGEWDMAENYLDTIESKSNLLTSPNKVHYFYNYKGLLYLGRKKYGAAKQNFYIALENSKDIVTTQHPLRSSGFVIPMSAGGAARADLQSARQEYKHL